MLTHKFIFDGLKLFTKFLQILLILQLFCSCKLIYYYFSYFLTTHSKKMKMFESPFTNVKNYLR